MQPPRARRIGQSSGRQVDLDAEFRLDVPASRLELFAIARHQNQIVPVRGKDIGERRADADRPAGD